MLTRASLHGATHLLRQMEEDMLTPTKDPRETDVALAERAPRAARRAAANAPDFAATEFMLTIVEAPTLPAVAMARTDSETMLAAWSTARWVEEQEARAATAARRASVPHPRRTPDFRSARRAARAAARRGSHWLLRIEAALDRLLPPGFGTLLGLFLCVSLSLALISSMLPLVDRF
jgi:hypothetical protein